MRAFFDLILQLRDPKIRRNKMSCSETCDPAKVRGSVSSGVCDHNVCQDPKGKPPS